MKYTLCIASRKHEPLETFAHALELFRKHIHASIKSGNAACNRDDGYYLLVEKGTESHVLDIREALSLAEHVGLFNDDSSIRHFDTDIDARVARTLFDSTCIHATAWHLGLLDPFL